MKSNMKHNNTLQFNSSLIGTRYPSDFTLPDFPRDRDGAFDRKKALEILMQYEYGVVTDGGITLRVTDVTDDDTDAKFGYSFCGKATHTALRFTFSRGQTTSEFTVDVFVPANVKAPTTVLQLDFVKRLPTKYCPVEELLDRGVAIAHVDYAEITADNNDFSDGLAKLLCDRSQPQSAGKIAVWAYAAGQVGKYLLQNGFAYENALYVAGHSRLGKTALLACAQYESFAGCFVNCSGCCGAAISRAKRGETVAKINEVFGYWFAPRFAVYSHKENDMPFDQHFLIAAVAPRKVCIVTASEDAWADTDAQYLCAEAASVVYAEQGVTGLCLEHTQIAEGEKNDGGTIAFFKRKGPHYFSREDWNFYLDCLC